MKTIDARQLSSLTLAYIGDAVYELHIREHLILKGYIKPDKLHHLAIRYVAANKQAAVLFKWLEEAFLTDEEISVVKRGRNAKSQSTPKNMSIVDYRHATAFETLLGFHYLMENQQRLDQLMSSAVHIIERENNRDRRDKS